jgi:hypothetical protein
MAWKPNRGIVVALVMALVALAVAIYGVTASPADAPTRAPQPSLSSSRSFVLMPDGRVEITDSRGRRVLRFDGKQWRQLDAKPSPRATP